MPALKLFGRIKAAWRVTPPESPLL